MCFKMHIFYPDGWLCPLILKKYWQAEPTSEQPALKCLLKKGAVSGILCTVGCSKIEII